MTTVVLSLHNVGAAVAVAATSNDMHTEASTIQKFRTMPIYKSGQWAGNHASCQYSIVVHLWKMVLR